MIEIVADFWFRAMMWMLLNPWGKALFLTVDVCLILLATYFIWVTREEK